MEYLFRNIELNIVYLSLCVAQREFFCFESELWFIFQDEEKLQVLQQISYGTKFNVFLLTDVKLSNNTKGTIPAFAGPSS